LVIQAFGFALIPWRLEFLSDFDIRFSDFPQLPSCGPSPNRRLAAQNKANSCKPKTRPNAYALRSYFIISLQAASKNKANQTVRQAKLVQFSRFNVPFGEWEKIPRL